MKTHFDLSTLASMTYLVPHPFPLDRLASSAASYIYSLVIQTKYVGKLCVGMLNAFVVSGGGSYFKVGLYAS